MKALHGLFISQSHRGQVYVAERARKSSNRLLWSVMPHAPIAPDVRIGAGKVPLAIRRQAYRFLAIPRSRLQPHAPLSVPEQASTSVAPVANRERIAIGAAELWQIQQQIAMEIAVGCETDFPLSQGSGADQWKE